MTENATPHDEMQDPPVTDDHADRHLQHAVMHWYEFMRLPGDPHYYELTRQQRARLRNRLTLQSLKTRASILVGGVQ